MAKIHASAVVDASAKIAEDVEIGPFCVVGANVEIGAGTRLIAQCYVEGYTTLGKNNTVYPTACIGAQPQDYGFDAGTVSYLKIGDNNTFREGFTAHVGTKEDTETVIGNDCYFMANSHVAHNCVIGNKVIMVNSAVVAGYVTVGDNVLLSGLTAVHQFGKVGRFAVLSGGTAISQDLPPFMICSERNGAIRNINIIGLRRNGFSKEVIRAIKNMYKIFYRSELNSSDAIAKIREEVESFPEVEEFIDFVETSKRGVIKGC